MRFAFESRMLARTLSRWLYPAWCATCGDFLHLTEEHLCRTCFGRLNPIRPPMCLQCGVELAPFARQSKRCGRCQREQFAFDEVISLWRYDEEFKKLLHQIKYDRKYWLLEVFSRTLKRKVKANSSHKPDVVISVPLDRKRLRERKFNQSEMIAGKLAKSLDIPMAKDVILRTEYRTPQSLLSRKERQVNLRNLFQVRNPDKIRNQWILLVDDVVTTGATVNECSKVLKEAGAKTVSVFSLARTPTLS